MMIWKKSSLECGQFLAGGISPNVFYSIIPWIQKSFFDDDVSTFKYIDYCFYCCEKIPIVSVEGLFSQSLQSVGGGSKETWWSSFLFLQLHHMYVVVYEKTIFLPLNCD